MNIFNAISDRNLNSVKEAINSNADLEDEASHGRTPLLIAVCKNELEIVKVLLAAGANPQKTDTHGRSVLHLAGEKNASPEMFKEFLKLQSVRELVNAVDNHGRTVMHCVAEYGKNPEVIDILVAAGAEIMAIDDDGFTPLHDASESNKEPEIAEKLIEYKAEVNAIDKDKETPLHIAGDNSNKEVAIVLDDNGADLKALDDSGRTPLDIQANLEAISYNNHEKSKKLIREFLASGENNNQALDIVLQHFFEENYTPNLESQNHKQLGEMAGNPLNKEKFIQLKEKGATKSNNEFGKTIRPKVLTSSQKVNKSF